MFILREITGNEISNSVFIVVCLAMLFAVIIAKTLGCTLPILAKILHLDPALMAGPLITTLVDTITLLVYFAIANAILTI
jgi:magnesium transporter